MQLERKKERRELFQFYENYRRCNSRFSCLKKKSLSRLSESHCNLSKAQRTCDHPIGGVEQTNRICRIAVSPRPSRYGGYDAPARRASVSRSLRWDNDRNPHARSATASRWGSLTRRCAPHPLKLILAASFCRRGRGALAICEPHGFPIGSRPATARSRNGGAVPFVGTKY